MHTSVVPSKGSASTLDCVGFTVSIFPLLLFYLTHFLASFLCLLAPNGRTFCDYSVVKLSHTSNNRP